MATKLYGKMNCEIRKHAQEAKRREATVARRKNREEKWWSEMGAFCSFQLPSSWQQINGVNVLPKRPICRDKSMSRWPGAHKTVELDPHDDEIFFREELRTVNASAEEDAMIAQLDLPRKAKGVFEQFEHKVYEGARFVLRPIPTELTAGMKDCSITTGRKPAVLKRPSFMNRVPKTVTSVMVESQVTEPVVELMRQQRPKLGRTGIKIADYLAGTTGDMETRRALMGS